MEGNEYYKKYLASKKRARKIHKFLKNKDVQRSTIFLLEIVSIYDNQLRSTKTWDELLINDEELKEFNKNGKKYRRNA